MDLSEEVLSGIKGKDSVAFAKVYDRYAPALYGVIHRIVVDEHKAQDALQEAFVKIWRNLDRWDPEKAKLFTWMYSIARNTAVDKVRYGKQKHKYDLQEARNISDHSDTSAYAEQREVCSLLKELAPKYQQVLQCLFLNGMTQREMAKETGIPLGTIKSRLAKALQLLKTKYGTTIVIITLIVSTHG